MKYLNCRTMVILALFIAVFPGRAEGYDLRLQSDTFIDLYQVDAVVGADTDHALLYEYISLMLSLSPNLDLTLASEGYIYEHLFQAATNPALLSSAINLVDEDLAVILRARYEFGTGSGAN